jgi:sec-independent protein translocase protein TatB
MPLLLRKAGRFVNRMRGMAADFRANFDELARQAELDELRKEVEALRNNTPLRDIEQEMNKPFEFPPQTPGTPEPVLTADCDVAATDPSPVTMPELAPLAPPDAGSDSAAARISSPKKPRAPRKPKVSASGVEGATP